MIGTAIRPERPARASSRTTSRSPSSAGTSLAAFVDEEEPLGGAVEDDPEIGADRRHEPARGVDRRELLARVASSAKNPCAPIASTPSGPSTSGSVNDAAE